MLSVSPFVLCRVLPRAAWASILQFLPCSVTLFAFVFFTLLLVWTIQLYQTYICQQRAAPQPTAASTEKREWTNILIIPLFFLNSAIKVWGLTLILSWASQKWCSPPLWRSAARPSGKRRPQGLSSYQRFTTQAGLKQGQTNTIISLCLHFTS